MSEFDIILDNSRLNLREIPPRVLNMYNIKMLYLEGNAIDFIPDDFFPKLHQLQWLDLRKNRIKCIPKTIGHHQNLTNLLLSENLIEELPLELGLVPTLKVLQIQNNPIVYPSEKVLEKGTKEICRYLKELYDESTKSRVDEEKEEDDEVDLIERPRDFSINKSSTDLIPAIENKSKITHRLQRDESKISLKSSYHHNSIRDKVCDRFTMEKATLRKNWLNQLKVLLAEQERILQQEKNLKALTSWRTQKKSEPLRQVPSDEISSPPYGTYPECNRILSREDLTRQIDKFVLKSRSPAKKIDIDQVINELIGQLKDMQQTVHTDEKSCSAAEMHEAGDQINAIIAVHKKLLKLQETNDSTL